MKCGKKGNICAHLANMMSLWEELAGMPGAPINDYDFTAMIIGSLPTAFQGLICTMTAAIWASGWIVTYDIIIAIVLEEADHIKIDNGANSMTNNTALTTTSKGQIWHGKGKSKKSEVKCNNCSHGRRVDGTKGGERKAKAFTRRRMSQPAQPQPWMTMHSSHPPSLTQPL